MPITDSPTAQRVRHIPIEDLLIEVESGMAADIIDQRYFARVASRNSPTPLPNRFYFALPELGLCDLYNTMLPGGTEARISFDTDLIHIQLRRRGSLISGGNKEARLNEGAELLVTGTRAGQPSVNRIESDHAFQALVIHLRPTVLREALAMMPERLPLPLAAFLRTEKPAKSLENIELHYVMPERVARALDGLLDVEPPSGMARRYRQTLAGQCLLESLILLQTPEALAQRQGFVGKNTRPFERAHDIIRNHFCEPPPIDDIARAVGVSRRKLTAGFKNQYGMTIMQYALTLRMEEARRLLKTGDFLVSQVGYRVGYQQPSNFTQAYKAFFSHPPKTDT